MSNGERMPAQATGGDTDLRWFRSLLRLRTGEATRLAARDSSGARPGEKSRVPHQLRTCGFRRASSPPSGHPACASPAPR
jgi:hypothetical protein